MLFKQKLEADNITFQYLEHIASNYTNNHLFAWDVVRLAVAIANYLVTNFLYTCSSIA